MQTVAERTYFFFVVFFAFLAGAFFLAAIECSPSFARMVEATAYVSTAAGHRGGRMNECRRGSLSPGVSPSWGNVFKDYFFFAFFFAFFLAAFFFAGIECPPPFGHRVRSSGIIWIQAVVNRSAATSASTFP